jgi:cyclopropane-fatty-acyl-phospholipid synthase
MRDASRRFSRPISRLFADLERSGARLVVHAPGAAPLRIGQPPELASVVFSSRRDLVPLARRDHLRLTEAYLNGRIQVEGSLLEVMKLLDSLDMENSRLYRAWLKAQLLVRDRREYDRQSIAVHYDHSVEFYARWLDRTRTYSHGFFAAPDEDLADAQTRKLQYAIDALGLQPGMRVLDMGAGWGCFVEYAGERGIRVHAITISRAQHDFVARLIERKRLPCSVELVHLFDYRPDQPFDGAVFLGTLEHVPEYSRVAAFLDERLTPDGRVYADFCAQHTSFEIGRFMKKYLWPGPIRYVDLGRLVSAFTRRGFNVHELRDDTASYAATILAWGDALESSRRELAAMTDEPTVRAFLLFLRGSHHFLSRNRTQAYHLVVGRRPAPLRSVVGAESRAREDDFSAVGDYAAAACAAPEGAPERLVRDPIVLAEGGAQRARSLP